MRVLLAIVLGLWLGDPAVAKPRSLLHSLAPAATGVTFRQGIAPGVPADAMGTAAYDPDSNTIYYQGLLDPATRAHEMGHAFDHQSLSNGDRNYFQKLLQAPAGEWRSGTGLQGGTSSPNEIFADYYQAAALGLDPRRQSESAYTNIGPVRLKRFEAALDRLARRQNMQPYQR